MAFSSLSCHEDSALACLSWASELILNLSAEQIYLYLEQTAREPSNTSYVLSPTRHIVDARIFVFCPVRCVAYEKWIMDESWCFLSKPYSSKIGCTELTQLILVRTGFWWRDLGGLRLRSSMLDRPDPARHIELSPWTSCSRPFPAVSTIEYILYADQSDHSWLFLSILDHSWPLLTIFNHSDLCYGSEHTPDQTFSLYT